MIRTFMALLVGLLLCSTMSAGLTGCSKDSDAPGYEKREPPPPDQRRTPPGPRGGAQSADTDAEGETAPPPEEGDE